MRFHTLAVAGFGPFAGEETIDFDRLATAGLFLLGGPTGAGKTTILDAICYALFGETTGEGQARGSIDGRSGAELRCTRAAADQKTEVRLTFSVGGRTWRVERNPDYERLALRGGGRAQQLAKATLYRARGEGDWEPVATKINDVNERIQSLTGFTADQFRRVIVIPQNRFRDVLVSEAGAREGLLQRIFGTDVYERFEVIVAERRSVAEADWQTVRRERDALLGPHAWAEALDDAAVATEIESRVAAATAAAESARRTFDEAASRHTAAAEALGAATAIANLATAVVDAGDRDRRARDALAAQAAVRVELAAAVAAAEPVRLLRECDRRDRLQAVAVEAERQAETAAAVARGTLKAARAAHEAATAAHGRTAAIATRIGTIAAAIAAATEARGNVEAARATLSAAEAVEAEAARGAEAAHMAAAGAAAALADAEAELAAAVDRFGAGAAARLAAGLVAHEACPVCGSVEHPRPAQPAGDVPTEALLERLRTGLAVARDGHESAGRTAAQADVSLAAARASAAAARTGLAGLPAAPDVSALEDERRRLDAERTDLDAGLQTASSNLQRATAAAGDAERRREVARAEREAAAREAGAARTAFETAFAAAPFATAAEVAAAAREPQVVAALQESIAAADREATEAAAALAAATAALGGRTPPDVGALTAAQAELAGSLAEAREADEEARTRLHGYRDLGVKHAALAGRFAAATAELRTAHELHQKVTGQSHPTDKVSFHRWVLGAVLEEVLAEATTMLRDMTRGRYVLLRADSAGGKRALAGLDIDVLDTWHGTRRPARTLSGGETFLASLALSLALARTAERHAGGRRLETVFIDEGFGSLDAETLELAMQTLTTLRDQGRVVGVISHVDEMQRSIPVQLRVERRGDESATRIVGVPDGG